MSKKILIVLSEWGCWREELIGLLEASDNIMVEVLERGLRRFGW